MASCGSNSLEARCYLRKGFAMRFVCESCHAQYAIRDEKVGPRGVATRCRHCGHRIVVMPRPTPTLAPVERSQTRVMSLQEVAGLLAPGTPQEKEGSAQRCGFDAAGAEWFLASGDVPVGPLDAKQIQAMHERREITRETLCWKAGMTDWTPLAEIPTLAGVLFPREAERPEHSGAVAVGLQSLIPQQAEGPATPLLSALVEEELRALQPPPLPTAREPEPEPEPEPALVPLAAEAPVDEAPRAEEPAVETAPAISPGPPVHLYLFGLALWILVLGVGAVTAVNLLTAPRATTAPPPLVATGPTVTVPAPSVVVPPPPLVARTVTSEPVPAAAPTTPVVTPTRELTPAPAERARPPRRPAQRAVAPARPASDTRDPNDKAFEAIFGEGTPAATPPVVTRHTLEHSDILEVLVAHQAELKACTSRTQEAGLSGTAVMRWSIRNDGTPANVQVLTPDFRETPLASCLVAAVRRMRFPAYSGPQLAPRDVPLKF